jgi:hypothetical protein
MREMQEALYVWMDGELVARAHAKLPVGTTRPRSNMMTWPWTR